ncbi:MAG: aminoacyl-histidine dipeptidase [Epulopiscium sp. Nele67-Bin005]|nr:MAG: aminoacyl-histidine dipeptidase [Epulopiscium sp. Nele67-Bin005]
MSKVLSDLQFDVKSNVVDKVQIQEVFNYFETLSSIPRGSGNEKEVSDYMVTFAKNLGLEVKQDQNYNIYIYKPATKGYENCPTVILQGHLDIVCEKDKETEFDFEKQGLNLFIDGDWIKAKGTTLGADNGVSIAYQMAVLADNTLEHPALECLMTTEEETGMGGVDNMHPEYLNGKILINIDTTHEGEFLVSCAGGARAYLSLPLEFEDNSSENVSYHVHIQGLVGGHSGGEIHHERANANVLMGRVLEVCNNKYNIKLSTIDGGTKDNVITRECDATISVQKSQSEAFLKTIQELEQSFKDEYSAQDPNIFILAKQVDTAGQVIKDDVLEKLISIIRLLPYGVQGMSHQLENLVETSLNVGILTIENGEFLAKTSVRSSVLTRKLELLSRVEWVAKLSGAKCDIGSDYPAWQYAPESKIRDLAVKVYNEKYETPAEIKAVHAGLECGFLSQKLEGVDMIAFGPNMLEIHSPNERVSISSMARVYDYVATLLKEMKNY